VRRKTSTAGSRASENRPAVAKPSRGQIAVTLTPAAIMRSRSHPSLGKFPVSYCSMAGELPFLPATIKGIF
jgi:hypothetical protein